VKRSTEMEEEQHGTSTGSPPPCCEGGKAASRILSALPVFAFQPSFPFSPYPPPPVQRYRRHPMTSVICPPCSGPLQVRTTEAEGSFTPRPLRCSSRCRKRWGIASKRETPELPTLSARAIAARSGEGRGPRERNQMARGAFFHVNSEAFPGPLPIASHFVVLPRGI